MVHEPTRPRGPRDLNTPDDPLGALSRGIARILHRPLTVLERDQFSKYLNMLIKWQKNQRLLGSSVPAWIVENAFLDSALFLRALPATVGSILDIGSGAGIPGIPIKILKPEVRLVLVESRRRRVSFLSSVVRELALADTRVIAGRAEEVADILGDRVDAVVLRCAGNLERLLPIASRLVSSSGIVVAAGPPEARPQLLGEWLTVESHKPGKTRRFLVYRPA